MKLYTYKLDEGEEVYQNLSVRQSTVSVCPNVIMASVYVCMYSYSSSSNQ